VTATAGFNTTVAVGRLLVLRLDDPHRVTLRVAEEREGDHLHLGHRHDRLAAELLDLVERGLRVVDLDVESDVTVSVLRLADTAPMPLSGCISIP
jgi:hypothetical protein